MEPANTRRGHRFHSRNAVQTIRRDTRKCQTIPDPVILIHDIGNTNLFGGVMYALP